MPVAIRNEPPSRPDADWSRETPQKFWDPGRNLMRCIRRYRALDGKAGIRARIARRFWSLSHEFWRTVTRCDIELRTDIGGGLLLPHANGIVIHPDVVIGRNCLVFQQVTIGVGRPDSSGREVPVIGDRVNISAGARLVGGITIGDGALIGLNAVVLHDVPPGATAVGVPARILPDDYKRAPN